MEDEIQTTFNTDDIDELGGVIVEGDEPEIDDLPDVDEDDIELDMLKALNTNLDDDIEMG